MTRLSIITAMHNCVDLTRRYLDSLLPTLEAVEWELILVDDASTDETRELMAEYASHPNIRCFHNSENLGFAQSNNFGAKKAKGDVLAFLNNDLVLTPKWIEPMLECLAQEKSVGVVGNIQLQTGNGLIDHAGVFFGPDGMPRQARKNRRSFPRGKWTEWNAVTAACMLIRKPLFMEVGGFDTAYRNGFEDIDLCVKLRTSGYRHFVVNTSRIYHAVSASPGRHRRNAANSEIFRKRWTSQTREWGEKEWPSEYLKRYARHWWKFNLGKLTRALYSVARDSRSKNLHYR